MQSRKRFVYSNNITEKLNKLYNDYKMNKKLS